MIALANCSLIQVKYFKTSADVRKARQRLERATKKDLERFKLAKIKGLQKSRETVLD